MIRGGVMVCIDLIEGMPLWWTVLEGVGFTATGVVVFTLQQLAGDPDAPGANEGNRNKGGGSDHGG